MDDDNDDDDDNDQQQPRPQNTWQNHKNLSPVNQIDAPMNGAN